MRWALITGGTDGIGCPVACQLAAAGNGVLIVGTNSAKGIRAEGEIRRDSRNSQVYFQRADLTMVSEAHRLADEVKSRCNGLHYLVHSAGMVRGHRMLTAEGVESNFAVNYLSRFALTNRLLPLLQVASLPGRSARIVLVGGAVRKGPIHYHRNQPGETVHHGPRDQAIPASQQLVHRRARPAIGSSRKSRHHHVPATRHGRH